MNKPENKVTNQKIVDGKVIIDSENLADMVQDSNVDLNKGEGAGAFEAAEPGLNIGCGLGC